jgi:hypothetical protein
MGKISWGETIKTDGKDGWNSALQCTSIVLNMNWNKMTIQIVVMRSRLKDKYSNFLNNQFENLVIMLEFGIIGRD